MKSLDTDRLQG